jgi:GNAT superfamily N-acetyltransferase
MRPKADGLGIAQGDTPGAGAGFVLSFRDLRPSDGRLLDELFGRMSERSRYLRFHAAVATLDDRRREALLDVDGDHHLALAATVDQKVVGIARFIRDPCASDSAEIAIAVADPWHRRGVGRNLLQRLRGRATAAGITRLRAEVLRCNRPAQALFYDVFADRLIRTGDHFVEMIALVGTEPSWEITMDDVLADLLS